MKKIIYSLVIAFLASFMITSCEEDENMDPVGNWDLSASVIISPEDGYNMVLNELDPNERIYFEWEAAVASSNFQIRYTIMLDTLGSTDYDTPIVSFISDNSGKSTTANITVSDVDLALSYAGYVAGEIANVEWTVMATCQDTYTYATNAISLTRFETEYTPSTLFIAGAATEIGTDVTQAIPMRNLTDSNVSNTNIFEAYTHLETGSTFYLYSNQGFPAFVYGVTNGEVVKNGEGITVDESAEYRITVNLNDNTYSLLKIEKWSVVGSVISNGWGGDEPLQYIGGGIWQTTLGLISDGSGGFVFRANGDWAYLMKRIQGTQDNVYMESQSSDAGISIEDIPLATSGSYIVTLDLSDTPYTYSLEQDATINPPSTIPNQLYLLSGGSVVGEFTLDNGIFTSTTYLPLQQSETYELNSSMDGTGASYVFADVIGSTTSPDADSVNGTFSFGEGSQDITINHDQAYTLTVNFNTATVTWKYYNIKLFHWQDWDSRDEFLMTYQHPLMFTTTQTLETGYSMKFNSPWDNQFGADDPSALSGTMTNNGGSDFNNITTAGSYNVNITIDDTYSTGTYEFIAQ
ncbi:hypothetical protein NBRC110019_31990 [Neptunitalea chrysea]|uniref:SusE outer membrane protein domain-containing protein n=1 Tax=Neptunitalea chrysea TaxID=1647581 RepID=A0A9W6EX11_9FLAO|nr:SusE domain-containing protein [Neptunitalea chrysea]GLB54158.1 hypothetical protein NBRC110019_31990 [Neptunitalea chrysea]